ncbi:MBL fold metallo-hydrolase [Candidatus Bathyarchaeota archaeon]|nr:MAG: MBL fold metallo-hydrolase [Candidatus Bathyarchaeota archaeon]
MKIKMFTVGRLFTNCYVLSCKQTKEAIILDPGFDDANEAEKIFQYTKTEKLQLKYIVNTHGHPDHTCGNGIVKKEFNIPILIHEYDAYMLKSRRLFSFFSFKTYSPPADLLLHNGDFIKFGKVMLKVMHTPGHTRGSISLIGEKEVFSGDVLFAGSIGRTDFPESSNHDMFNSLKKLANLPDYFIVYPGHGPLTRIGEEKRNNPFLQSFSE